MLQQFDRRTRPQIRAADADDHKHVAVLTDLFRRLFNAGKFFLVVVLRQIDPAEEIVPRAFSALQDFFRRLGVLHCTRPGFVTHESLRVLLFQSDH